MRDGRRQPLIDRLQPHLAHQPPAPLSADRMAAPTQMTSHLLRAVPWSFQKLLVDQPHQRQVQRRLCGCRRVERRATDANEFTLPSDREPGVVGFDHFAPPADAQHPEARLERSRSTTSWPIIACSFSTSPSRALSAASALPTCRRSPILPRADHLLMNAVLYRQLRHRRLAADRFQRDLGLEICRTPFALPRHRDRPSLRSTQA